LNSSQGSVFGLVTSCGVESPVFDLGCGKKCFSSPRVSVTRSFTEYYNERDQINEEVMSGKYSALVWKKKHAHNCLGNLNGWTHAGDVRLSCTIILKWIMN